VLWLRTRRALSNLWRRMTKRRSERRSAVARARFWSELREGEREAEAQSRP